MSGNAIRSFDPRTGAARELDATEDGVADVDAAAVTARDACGWLAQQTPTALADLLLALGDGLEARRDELVATADTETALGRARLDSELTRAIVQFQTFAEECAAGSLFEATIDHARTDGALPQPDVRRMNVGIGVVAVFAASNFPFAFSVPGTDTASALAARSAVVVKAHPAHPRTSILAHTALREAAINVGAPAGIVGLVHGMEAGRYLAQHGAVSAIAFTGSRAGGTALQLLASQRDDPVPFYGELGSMNPVVITGRALTERGPQIAGGVLDSAMLGLGQFCTKPGLILLEESSGAKQFVADLRDQVARRPGGFLLAERISTSFEASVASLQTIDGVHVVRSAELGAERGWYARPTLVFAPLEVIARHPELTTECFGPLAVVATYRDAAELGDFLAMLEPALTATVHLTENDDQAHIRTLRDQLSGMSGRVVFNGYPTGVAVCRAQHHGGPWPATTNPLHTSVGLGAAKRFLRPVAFQDCPQHLLPEPLKDANPWRVPQTVNGAAVPRWSPTWAD
jgi:NADP-dependent aldehyde dehydrogenase